MHALLDFMCFCVLCFFVCLFPCSVVYGNHERQCWCGVAGADYARHGVSEACGYRCAGDNQYVCGGHNAINVFSMEGE